MNCDHCGAETTNGLALCERAQATASVYLEFLPVYFRNLARWRPGRAGARPVPGSREPRVPAPTPPDRVMRALDQAGNALTTWARMLEDARGIQAPVRDDETEQVAALCRWFAEHLTSIATTEWCGEFICSKSHAPGEECDGLGHHEHRLRRLTEQVVPGWYAGACQICGNPTYVVPGLTWVTCNGVTGYTADPKPRPIVCGATTYARDHLDVVLAEARVWVAPPVRLAETIVALVDREASVDDLRKRIAVWGARGKIATIRAHEYAPKRHRLGEVLDWMDRREEASA